MKLQITHFLSSIVSLLLFVLPQICWSQSFTVTNHLDLHRENEIISIPIKDLAHLVSQDKLEIRHQDQKEYLVSQLVDNDLDGKTDEVLFQASIGPRETKTFIIEAVGNGTAKPKSELSTFSRFVPERQNDYAWENDRVAFRIYGSQSAPGGRKQAGGGVDAFLKRVSYPVLNKWYKNNAEKEGAYHIDTGEGYDPYQVGASRGLGGIGVWDKDSLYVSANFTGSRTIAEGPLRTIFELTYAPWDANGRTVKEIKRVSLDLGSHLSRVTEIINSDQQVPNLVAGITLHDKKGQVNANLKEGWFRYWEPVDDSWLGSAIVMDPSKVTEFKDYRTTAKDQSHLLVFTKPENNQSTFYAGFAWAKSDHFKTAGEWEKYLSDFSKRLNSPLVPRFE